MKNRWYGINFNFDPFGIKSVLQSWNVSYIVLNVINEQPPPSLYILLQITPIVSRVIRGTIIDNIPYTTLPVGEPVVPGEYHEGGGDQAQDPVLPLHTAAPG